MRHGPICISLRGLSNMLHAAEQPCQQADSGILAGGSGALSGLSLSQASLVQRLIFCSAAAFFVLQGVRVSCPTRPSHSAHSAYCMQCSSQNDFHLASESYSACSLICATSASSSLILASRACLATTLRPGLHWLVKIQKTLVRGGTLKLGMPLHSTCFP